jgi:hypothetical protein
MYFTQLKKIIAIGLLLLPLGIIKSQITPDNRLEIILKDGFKNEKIYKSTKGYFILEAEAEKKEHNKLEVRYDLYNADLNELKTASVYIPTDMHYTESYSDDSCVYKIYKNNKQTFLITRVTITGLSVDTVRGTLPKGIELLNMKVVDSKVWFQSKLKSKTCILQVNLKSGESKVSEFIEKKWSRKTSIVNYQMASQSGELLVFLNKYIKRGVCELSQMRVNGSCELCDNIQLTGTGDKVISSVSGYRVSDNEMVYTGTYSRTNMNRSEGLFFAKSEGNKLSYINYVNFLDMKNFLSYQPEFSQKVIKTIKKLFNKNGKEYSINYNIAAHDIIPIPGGYLLVGEAYYPSYTSIPHTTTTMINGMMMTQTYYTMVFNGYRYTHAFASAFSTAGKLLWDQCFEMNPSEMPYYPKKFIRISEQTDKNIALVYTSGKYMVSKIIGFDGTVANDVKRDLINSGNENEKTSWTISNADYWYGNNFLVYGTQVVKNNADKSKRSVFYVNKVAF